ncbi:hypothetical protein FOB64_006754 [Candida albicans]|uniref:Uncharacterized protein n=1 Tax=Candida albicans TaxID=5476 RepID=A0A8H6BRX5_CANAX|nr:hypothetical protein FOB64_006754 [Candida albicans]
MDGAIGGRVQNGGTRATAGTVYPIPGTNLHPGTGISPPLARKSGSAETRAGAEIKLGPEPEPEPGSGPGAGSEAKAHIMAMSVTIPVAGASTSAHPTRGSRVLGRGQLYWSCSGSPSAT